MSASQAVAKVQRERIQVATARGALETRAGHIHPLVLTGGALLVGLVAGRVLGRPRLPRAIASSSFLVGVLQRPVAGLLEGLLATLLASANADPKAESPPETQSRAP